MHSAIFCKLLFSDGNSHFLILFVWYHFNYMSLPKQWVSEWLYLQEHLADDEGRAERDFQFIMTHSGTKHDIPGQGLCYRQLVTSTNLWSITGVFLTTLVEKKALSVQQFNSGKDEEMGSSSCCSLKRMTLSLHLVILTENRAWDT